MSTHHRISTRLSPWLRPILIGMGVGVVCTTALLLLCALLLFKLGISTSAVTPMAIAALGVGGFCGGFAAGLSGGRNGLLTGAVCGTLLCAVLLLIGALRGTDLTWGYAVLKWAVLTVCSAAGGVLGVNRRHP